MVGLSLLLLLVVFRSVVVPLMAALGFLLSVAATFGATVTVFQNGHPQGLIGADGTTLIASFLSMVVMAAMFGLDHGLRGLPRLSHPRDLRPHAPAPVRVLIDTFVVRMALVPAVLALTRHATWWLPGRVRERLQRAATARCCFSRLIARSAVLGLLVSLFVEAGWPPAA